MSMKNETITRAYMADVIYQELGYSRAESSDIVDSILEEISEALAQEGKVKIPNFGTFFTREKSARVGRNPKTMESSAISPRTVVSFYISNLLKKELNEAFENKQLFAKEA